MRLGKLAEEERRSAKANDESAAELDQLTAPDSLEKHPSKTDLGHYTSDLKSMVRNCGAHRCARPFRTMSRQLHFAIYLPGMYAGNFRYEGVRENR